MTFRWATVTGVLPLRIKIDGDTAAIPITPDSLIDPTTLVVSDRVRTEMSGNRLVVLGRAGGLNPASATAKGPVELATDAETITGMDTSTAVTTAGLAAVRARPVQGVIPSSIAVGSGSASVDADGLITFTDVSRLSLNDIFDGLGGDVYEIYALMVGSVANNMRTRMRADGVDQTTGYNYVGTITRNAAGPTRSSLFGTSFFGHWCSGAAYPPLSTGKMALWSPALAGSTNIRIASDTAASDRFMWDEYGEVSGVFDGLSVVPSAGTMSGTMKVVKIS
jgi:hypothetical protein